MPHQTNLGPGNVSSLWAFCPLYNLELDFLAFFKGLESFGLDGGEVYKYIIFSMDRDKPVSFFGIEPFHCACFHEANPPTRNYTPEIKNIAAPSDELRLANLKQNHQNMVTSIRLANSNTFSKGCKHLFFVSIKHVRTPSARTANLCHLSGLFAAEISDGRQFPL